MTPNGTDNVRLAGLGEKSFKKYHETLTRDYAADKVQAGVWSNDEAESKAASDVGTLLPKGPATPGHDLYSVRDEVVSAEVGVLWISPGTPASASWSGSTTSSSTNNSGAEATPAIS